MNARMWSELKILNCPYVSTWVWTVVSLYVGEAQADPRQGSNINSWFPPGYGGSAWSDHWWGSWGTAAQWLEPSESRATAEGTLNEKIWFISMNFAWQICLVNNSLTIAGAHMCMFTSWFTWMHQVKSDHFVQFQCDSRFFYHIARFAKQKWKLWKLHVMKYFFHTIMKKDIKWKCQNPISYQSNTGPLWKFFNYFPAFFWKNKHTTIKLAIRETCFTKKNTFTNIKCICIFCIYRLCLCSIVIASRQLEQLYSLSLCSREDCHRLLSRYHWNLQLASRYLIRYSQDERPAPSDRDRRMWHMTNLFYLFDAPVISCCTGHLKMYAEWSCR